MGADAASIIEHDIAKSSKQSQLKSWQKDACSTQNTGVAKGISALQGNIWKEIST